MARLDQQRQKRLEPKRVEEAKRRIGTFCNKIFNQTKNSFQFEFKGFIVTYYPYSGWASGKSIVDGRGLENLLSQLKQKEDKQ